jgi:cytochrome c oxidase assembly protein subunit 15
LIWVGGLVTTYDAGMAVPDWPSTYGYNLFLYPWQTWVAGPWDLFIEHGHRLLGATVGLIAIGFVVAVFACENRTWMRFAALAALAAVVFQGVLGGQRVLLDSRTLAMVHGCFGPAFFALCVALAAASSTWWRQPDDEAANENPASSADVAGLFRLAVVTTALSYVQLGLGAQLRHRDETSSPGQFQTVVVMHLLVAAVLAGHAVVVWSRARTLHGALPGSARPAAALALLVAIQLGLGIGTWVFKYGWPAWFAQYAWAQSHVNVDKSLPEVLVATAHVALGSLILATSLLVALRVGRRLDSNPRPKEVRSLHLEAAR